MKVGSFIHKRLKPYNETHDDRQADRHFMPTSSVLTSSRCWRHLLNNDTGRQLNWLPMLPANMHRKRGLETQITIIMKNVYICATKDFRLNHHFKAVFVQEDSNQVGVESLSLNFSQCRFEYTVFNGQTVVNDINNDFLS